MIKTPRFLFPAAFTLTMLTAWALPAGETVLQIDPAQTHVAFELGSLLHTVHGAFQLKRGGLRFDPANGAASGELVVDARSGESGSAARDRKMHKEILESERFPEIVFRPHRVEGAVEPQGTSHVAIHGTFSIHGGEHEMSVPADVQAAAGQYAVTAHFDVPYQKWGMKNPSTFVLRVNDNVEITVHTIAHTFREVSRN